MVEFNSIGTANGIKFLAVSEDGNLGIVGAIPQFGVFQFEPTGLVISREEMKEITKFMVEKL